MSNRMSNWTAELLAAFMNGKEYFILENMTAEEARRMANAAAAAGLRTVASHAWPNYGKFNLTVSR